TPSSTPTVKRTRIKAADVHWCISNAANLSLPSFATTFDHYDRQRCHARYGTILNNYIPKEHEIKLQ
ncbi:hypothetical protein BCR42DRAFT_299988, partial [Absidia repens]